MQQPPVSVLIVTVNSRERVLECLRLLESQGTDHQVLVADNGNDSDGTSTAIRGSFPRVQVETMPRNVGVGRALNQLAAKAAGEILVRLDDDMYVGPGFLAEIVKPFGDPRVGMVAALALQSSAEGLVDGFGMECDVSLVAYNRLRDETPDSEAGSLLGPVGCAGAYRRTAWDEVGGVDENFFVYTEDQDLAIRIRLAGWLARGAPDAVGTHVGGASTVADSKFQRQCAGFGRGFVLRRYQVLKTIHAPRTLVIESLTVLAGLVRGRTTVPLTSRLAGWRAAGSAPSFEYPSGEVDRSISLGQSIRRMRSRR